jgi:hypothetical protein
MNHAVLFDLRRTLGGDGLGHILDFRNGKLEQTIVFFYAPVYNFFHSGG